MSTKSEKEHYNRIEKRAKRIQTLYYKAVRETSNITQGIVPPFNFKEFPVVEKKVDKIVENLRENMEHEIRLGVEEEWEYAVKNNQKDVTRLAKKTTIPKEKLETYQSRNLEALSAFQDRKAGGLNLSERVWNLSKNLKGELEQAIDLGLADGRSASELSRDIRNFLNRPNDLYRRVRSDTGRLIQSQGSIKRIKAEGISYGPGVYKSSYKNAMRVARTEINSAYRMSDYHKRQQLDFVVGIEVKRSNHVYDCDVCESLKGQYPKDFIFTNWHPHCRCFTTSILNTEDEFIAQQRAILEGTNEQEDPAEYKESVAQDWETIKASKYDITGLHQESENYRFEHREPEKTINLDPSKKRGRVDIDVPIDIIIKENGIRVENVGLKSSVTGEFNNENKTFTIKGFTLSHGKGNDQLAEHMMKELKANLPEGYTLEIGGNIKKDGKELIGKLESEGFFKVQTSGQKESVNTIKDVPQGFKDYLEENKDRIERAQGRGTEPWWMKDNQSFVDQAMKPEIAQAIKDAEIAKEKAEKEKIEAEKAEAKRQALAEAKRQAEIEAKLQAEKEQAEKEAREQAEKEAKIQEEKLKAESKSPGMSVGEFQEKSKKIHELEEVIKTIEKRKTTMRDHKQYNKAKIQVKRLRKEIEGMEGNLTKGMRYYRELSIEEFMDYSKQANITAEERHFVYQVPGGDGRSYTGSFGFDINSFLRTGRKAEISCLSEGEVRTEVPRYKEVIDRIIAKNTLPEDLQTYRFTGYNYINSLLGLDEANGDEDAIMKGLNKLVGRDITDKGYLSVSANEKYNFFTDYPVKMEIKARKGTHAFITDRKVESEIILGRNQKHRIVGWRKDENYIVLETELF